MTRESTLKHGLLDWGSDSADGGTGPFRLSIAFVLRDIADLPMSGNGERCSCTKRYAG
jgi:hypothetical protein